MPEKKKPFLAVSRRAFLKGIGTTAVASAATGAQSFAQQLREMDPEQVVGPGPVPLALNLNGEPVRLEVEPRATLLDVLRERLDRTGAKEVCGRASCGACTVLLDGMPVYACMTLAIETEGREVRTVEGLAHDGQLSPLQDAFVQEDGLMCGYCTSGFLMSLTALLERNPNPSEVEVQEACAGHLCRCGTYPRVIKSALRAAGTDTTSRTEVIRWSHG
jgi:xanthine dehydrogenase YagT iron-sulfur-binding subunit